MNFHVITCSPISLNYGRVKLISLQIGFTGSFLSYKVTQFLFLPLKSRSTPSDLLAVVTSILSTGTNLRECLLAEQRWVLETSPLSSLTCIFLIREAAAALKQCCPSLHWQMAFPYWCGNIARPSVYWVCRQISEAVIWQTSISTDYKMKSSLYYKTKAVFLLGNLDLHKHFCFAVVNLLAFLHVDLVRTRHSIAEFSFLISVKTVLARQLSM